MDAESTAATTQLIRFDSIRTESEPDSDFRSSYRHLSPDHPSVQSILERVRNFPLKILSFDVFDTALLRNPVAEAVRFFEMAQRFLDHQGDLADLSPTDLFLARVFAARACYEMAPLRSGNREGTVSEIARVTCELAGIPHLTEAYLQNELDYESDNLTPNDLIPTLIDLLPASVQVVFLSDMYLQREPISRLLKVHFPNLEISTVYSSADGFGSKRAGSLFKKLENEFGEDPDAFLHIGDNLYSDYRSALDAGWNAIYLPIPESEWSRRKDSFDQLVARLKKNGVSLPRFCKFNG